MKKITAAFLATMMALSLAACGNGGGTKDTETKPVSTESAGGESTESKDSEAPAEMVEVNVAYMPDYASTNGVISAKELGYFEEEGIKVNLIQFADGPTIINAMESGSVDVGYIGQGAHKLCINGQATIFALAHVSNGDAIIGNKEKGVTTLEDLKGKQIAYSSGTSSEDILKKGLEKAGLTMDDITPVDMEATNLVTAMLSGSVDACAAWVPNTTKIMSELGDNGVKLCDNKTFIEDTVSLSSWICMPSYAEENKDLLKKFAKALYKGFDYRADDSHAEEVAGWIADELKLEKDTLLEQRDVADWTTSEFIKNNMGDVKAYYQLQQDTFVAGGACEKTPLENYILFDVMEEAVK